MWSFWYSSAPDSNFFSKYDDKVTFRINSKKYTVDASVPANTSLNTYIRQHANLRGTKYMCQEGGCGACVVAVTSTDLVTGAKRTFAVNSCLVLVFSCHGWDVTTIEGVGSKNNGYNKVQTTLAHFNGTQCGYCSPGMVMNMYSLLEGKSQKVTMKEAENSFGGNICRCTGYRPILDAFKSLCVDAPPALKQKCADIEDIYRAVCPKNGEPCAQECRDVGEEEACEAVHVTLPGSYWCRVTNIADIFEVMNKMGDVTYMLVSGNTAHGVYRRKIEPKVFIDINGVKELKTINTDPDLVLGANVSLTDAMETFYNLADKKTEYAYTKVLADHIDLIANVPVRNAGTLAGNLSTKYQYNQFPSDIFLILETVGAKLTIVDKSGKSEEVTPQDYLKVDMKGKIMKQITLPKFDQSHIVKTYKIMPRAQNAHAYVNAGFHFKLGGDVSGKVAETPTIVLGGINPKFIHATKTENFLNGKSLYEEAVMKDAVKTLDSELDLDHVLPDASPEYRSGLAKALLYKFFLSMASDKVDKKYASGATILERPLSSGSQKYEVDQSTWPLGQPVSKLEALTQCSGEAKFVNDLPPVPGELFGAFVLTRVAQGTLSNIDPSEALKMPGVVRCFTAQDIPGKNNFTPFIFIYFEDEPVFCSGKIIHGGQVAAMVVAETQQLANEAASRVKLTYTNFKKPVVSLREAIQEKDPARIKVKKTVQAKYTKDDEVSHVVKGSFDIGGQYHFTMETQTSLCVPTEDGLDVFAATQWMHLAQVAISEALNIPENSINMQVRRLGGAYGSKISRATQVAVACALAAHTLARPVRMAMLLESNMEAMGKRPQVATDYEAGVDADGEIKYLKCDFYENYGTSFNEPIVEMSLVHMKSCYDNSTWSLMGKAVKTDIPANTYCRAPSSTEGIAVIETIMEHIAKTIKKDSTDVRLKNMEPANNPIPGMIQDIKKSSDYEAREKNVEEFNKANRWKKRGISLVPMGYPFQALGNFAAMVSVYGQDGTVAVVHGGVECGQGINTKVAQVTAHFLGIPLDQVSIKASNSMVTPNGFVTGGSITSESCCYAAMVCCKTLLERLKPFRTDKEQTWKELVLTAFMSMVDLSATYMFSPKDGVKPYTIWGVTVAEVEIDVLTGQHQVLRVDLLEDAGKSMSPEVDVGQVEGAFIMGLGYWLHEELVYNLDTGELLTNRTWNYKPPGAKDIPIDFRVELRRNAPNPFGVLRSKATGEPPLCMSYGAFVAVRNALASARVNAGAEDEWCQMDGPATAENIFLKSLTSPEQFAY